MNRGVSLRIAWRSALALGWVLFGTAELASQSQTLALVVGSLIEPWSEVTSGPVTVLISDGKVVATGRDVAVPKDAKVWKRLDAVAFPGLIDAACALGVAAARQAPERAFVPDLRVADGLDGADAEFPRHLAAGVTTFHAVPSPSEPVGGRSAVLGWFADRPRFANRSFALGLSLDEDSYQSGRAPTSAVGFLQDLPSVLQRPSLGDVRDRRVPVFVRTGNGAQIDLALALAHRHGFRLIVSVDLESLEGRVPALADAAIEGVVVRAFVPETEPHLQRRLADLARAGVRFAFGSDGGPPVPEAVRLSALSARRVGVPLAALERAVTLNAAELLGLDEELGSLTPGRQGDVVLATGHPLDPRSRILAVVQDGRILAAEDRR